MDGLLATDNGLTRHHLLTRDHSLAKEETGLRDRSQPPAAFPARELRVGTRRSPLALQQTESVIARLRALFPHWRFVRKEIVTQGDVTLGRTLPEFGQTGVFVKEIETALLEGSIDIAVHSLKDMPIRQPDGLVIAAVPERADARDALVLASRHRGKGLGVMTLPEGARIGTGSFRRSAQLRAVRPDFQVSPVRGTVQTRLRKLEDEGFDAIILAAAGLERLGMDEEIGEKIPLDIALPAPGQGALGVQAREDDAELLAALRHVEHGSTRAATDAERAVLAALGGGCYVPIGAYARTEGDRLVVKGVVVSRDGTESVRDSLEGDVADGSALGQTLGERLREQGAQRLLDDFEPR